MKPENKTNDNAFKHRVAAWAAAERAEQRCNVFHLTKRFNSLPRKPMSHETLQQLGLV